MTERLDTIETDPRFELDPLRELYSGEGLTFSAELAHLTGSPGSIAALAALNPSLRTLLEMPWSPDTDRFARRIVEIMLARDDDEDEADG